MDIDSSCDRDRLVGIEGVATPRASYGLPALHSNIAGDESRDPRQAADRTLHGRAHFYRCVGKHGQCFHNPA
jgi:hypothetical protein